MSIMQAGAFKAGDIITIASAMMQRPLRASIICFRHANSSGRDWVVVDVLREDGQNSTYYLHDVAKWNPEKVAATFGVIASALNRKEG